MCFWRCGFVDKCAKSWQYVAVEEAEWVGVVLWLCGWCGHFAYDFDPGGEDRTDQAEGHVFEHG